MTIHSFNDAPIDIILEVLRHLKPWDLTECQKVCKTWYTMAHPLLLKKTKISSRNVGLFLRTTESNPLYTQPIKHLLLSDTVGSAVDVFDRLFAENNMLSIQTLTVTDRVTFRKLIRSFGFAMFASNSHTLERFDCDAPLVWKCRSIVDRLPKTLKNAKFMRHLDLDSLKRFSHLEDIDLTWNRGLKSFELALPLFGQEFTLKHLTLRQGDDRHEFLEAYLNTKTKEEQNQILQKLSKLETLTVRVIMHICPNFIHFMSHYLTGLKSLHYESDFVYPDNWNDTQTYAFNKVLLGTIKRLTHCTIKLYNMKEADFVNCLPNVFENVYYNKPPTSNNCTHKPGRALKLWISNNEHLCGILVFLRNEKSTTMQQQLGLTFPGTQTLLNSRILHLATKYNINTVHLSYSSKYPPNYVSLLNQMLDKLPTATKLTLGLPVRANVFQLRSFPQITHLTLYNNSRVPVSEKSIVFCTHLFPKIKYLDLLDCLGEHSNTPFKVTIPLHNVNLERLYLDVSLFRNLHRVQGPVFLLLTVHTLDNNQKHNYIVSLGSLRIKKIKDITTVVNTTNHVLHVDLFVGSLKFIQLYLFRSPQSSRSQGLSYRQHAMDDDLMETTLSLV